MAPRVSALLGVVAWLDFASRLVPADGVEEVGLFSVLRGAGRVDADLAVGEPRVGDSSLAGVFSFGVDHLVFEVSRFEPRAFRRVLVWRDHFEGFLLLLAGRLRTSHVFCAGAVLLVHLCQLHHLAHQVLLRSRRVPRFGLSRTDVVFEHLSDQIFALPDGVDC